MSLTTKKTFELFRSFMPRKKEIKDRIGDAVIDLREYPSNYFHRFDPSKEFVKWALSEVAHYDDVPEGMSSYTLRSGLYAVFISDESGPIAQEIFEYIFRKWLPTSDYIIDSRPHFDILRKHLGPTTNLPEEEIWIPVKRKE